MECIDSQPEVASTAISSVNIDLTPKTHATLDPLLSDGEVADLLVVTIDWVRSHSGEIPGFRPLGMYYRFHRVPFEQWLGGMGRLLKPEQAADLLKVPTSWVYANADHIPGVLRLGRYVRFRPSVVEKCLRGSEACQ